jgi:hypothetical protein
VPALAVAATGIIAYEVVQWANSTTPHHNYALHNQGEKEKKASRKDPKDLSEQIALAEAKAKPFDPKKEIMEGKIKDPRYQD